MPDAIATKTIRISLPAALYRQFRVLTLLDGTTMSEVIRGAIETRVRARVPEAISETFEQQPVGNPLSVHNAVRTSAELPCTASSDHEPYKHGAR